MNQKKEFAKWQGQELGLVKLKRNESWFLYLLLFALNRLCPLVNGLILVEIAKIVVGSLGYDNTWHAINCLTWMTNSLWWLPSILEESRRSHKVLVKTCAPRDV